MYIPKKGFTLIELLVVLGIVAFISAVVILTLNPAELLKQSRDSVRLADLSAIKKAISIYMTAASNLDLGAANTCYMSIANGVSRCGVFSASITAVNATTSRGVAGYNVYGGGWLPVQLTAITPAPPLTTLPIDPINDSTYYYAYAASSTSLTFELDANMESAKYSTGSRGVEANDG
ncbi:MAG: prepilin-type N-terminal cleavage/methylation domain-containing protein, partial [Candidatus Liptonbacteria bacterium]